MEVLNERNKTYGKFKDVADTAQELKAIMHMSPNWVDLPAKQRESLEMIATKISRALHGNPLHEDNWLDIAGYATLVIKDV